MANTSDAEIFNRLRQLLADCGSSKHDQVIALITACICEGMDKASRIIGALKALGFNPQHVGMMLKNGTGSSPERHHWYRDEAGHYHLHGEPS